MKALFLVTQTGYNQHEALLIGKNEEAQLHLRANKSTLHACICCVSLPLPSCTQTYDEEGSKEGTSASGHRLEYSKPHAALCASFELSNIQVRTRKCIHLLCVRAQH